MTFIKSRKPEVLAYLITFNQNKNRMPAHKEILFDLKIGRGSLNRILAELVDDKKLVRSQPRVNYSLLNGE